MDDSCCVRPAPSGKSGCLPLGVSGHSPGLTFREVLQPEEGRDNYSHRRWPEAGPSPNLSPEAAGCPPTWQGHLREGGLERAQGQWGGQASCLQGNCLLSDHFVEPLPVLGGRVLVTGHFEQPVGNSLIVELRHRETPWRCSQSPARLPECEPRREAGGHSLTPPCWPRSQGDCLQHEAAADTLQEGSIAQQKCEGPPRQAPANLNPPGATVKQIKFILICFI